MDVGADFGVGFELVETLNDVAVAVEDVLFVIAVAVGDGFAAGEFAARFDLDVHGRTGDDGGVNRHPDGQWIVHGRAGRIVFRGEVD